MALEPDIERDAPQSNTQHPPKLLKFRDRTGINTPDLLALRHGERPGPNVGVYARVIQEERKAKWQYHAISSVINVIFLGQILVAAALTALGASNTSHIAITILGSVNTVIAGVQTYLKGQGLPNRLRQYEFGLRKLREYIVSTLRGPFPPYYGFSRRARQVIMVWKAPVNLYGDNL